MSSPLAPRERGDDHDRRAERERDETHERLVSGRDGQVAVRHRAQERSRVVAGHGRAEHVVPASVGGEHDERSNGTERQTDGGQQQPMRARGHVAVIGCARPGMSRGDRAVRSSRTSTHATPTLATM